MCLIVDINVAEAVLLQDNDPDFQDLHRHLFTTKAPPAQLVYGGRLTEEYEVNRDIRRILRVLDQAGRTRIVSNDLIETECQVLEQLGVYESNDVHILALARAGKVRLLCTRDKALQNDFRNKAILDNPRGKVYTDRSHQHLLVRFCKPRS